MSLMSQNTWFCTLQTTIQKLSQKPTNFLCSNNRNSPAKLPKIITFAVDNSNEESFQKPNSSNSLEISKPDRIKLAFERAQKYKKSVTMNDGVQKSIDNPIRESGRIEKLPVSDEVPTPDDFESGGRVEAFSWLPAGKRDWSKCSNPDDDAAEAAPPPGEVGSDGEDRESEDKKIPPTFEALTAVIDQAREALRNEDRKAPGIILTRSTRTVNEPAALTSDQKKKMLRELPQINPVLSIPLRPQSQSEYVPLGKSLSEKSAVLSPSPAALDPTQLAHEMLGCCAQLLSKSASLGSTVPVLVGDKVKAEAENEVLRFSLKITKWELESARYRCEKLTAMDKIHFQRIQQQDNLIARQNEELEALREDARKHNADIADLRAYWTQRTRVEMISAGPEERATWDLSAEIATFRQIFPGEAILEQPGTGGTSGSRAEVNAAGTSNAVPVEERGEFEE